MRCPWLLVHTSSTTPTSSPTPTDVGPTTLPPQSSATTTTTPSSATFTGLDLTGRVKGAVTAISLLNIDCSLGNYFTKTISSNSTFTFSNVPTGAYGCAVEIENTSGTITWPAAVKWPGDITPVLSTGKTHLFIFFTDDGGTRWRGMAQVNYTT